MRGQKRLSPFEQLRQAIDNELYDVTLRTSCQMSTGEQLDVSFILGYREALSIMQARAEAIYNRHMTAARLVEYLTADETERALLEMLEKERG